MTSGLEEKHCEATELFSPEIITLAKRIPQFDIVTDFSDHIYANTKQSFNSRDAIHRAISKEWKILGKSLPDSIYVQVNEQRIDLMRAAIIGPQGTPYHDGFFFFDIFFPTNYPNVPPKVRYRSYGLRLNPNLYETGYVCLSLLNTWKGKPDEQWIPKKSTILQVLVSIQALVLNEKPYFNEPFRIIHSEKSSKSYNEIVFLLSCKSMIFLLRQPPKSFKDLVAIHFYERSQVILTACHAYINGFQRVGYYQKDCPFLEKREQVSFYIKSSMKMIYDSLVTAFGTINPSPTHGGFYEKLNKMVVETKNMYKIRDELKRLEAEKNMPFLLRKIRSWHRVLKKHMYTC